MYIVYIYILYYIILYITLCYIVIYIYIILCYIILCYVIIILLYIYIYRQGNSMKFPRSHVDARGYPGLWCEWPFPLPENQTLMDLVLPLHPCYRRAADRDWDIPGKLQPQARGPCVNRYGPMVQVPRTFAGTSETGYTATSSVLLVSSSFLWKLLLFLIQGHPAASALNSGKRS